MVDRLLTDDERRGEIRVDYGAERLMIAQRGLSALSSQWVTANGTANTPLQARSDSSAPASESRISLSAALLAPPFAAGAGERSEASRRWTPRIV